MQLIEVKVLNEDLSKKGQDKLNSQTELVDEHGHSREYYENLEIPIPEFFSKKQKELDFDEEDYEVKETVGYFCISDFLAVVGEPDMGTSIYLKGGLKLWVKETPRQIKNKIKKQQ